MQTSIQVCKLFGIPVRLHFTFLFIFFAIILAFANWSPADSRIPLGLGGLDLSPFMRYLLSFIAAILFFFTLLLHELAHSLVAMRFGTKIHSITLFFFGGLAMMEDIPRNPAKEWRIAIAGPLMSLALGGLLLSAYLVLRSLDPAIYHPIGILVMTIGIFNLMLAVFNLLPAFPMDGGRILRALLARRMSFLKATRRAALIGKIFAFGLVIMGFTRDPFSFILTGRWETNFWLPLLAIFLFMAAAEEERATATFATLEGIKVRNVMRTEGTTVPENITVTELVKAMLADKTTEYAVVDANGNLRGFVTMDRVKKIPALQRDVLRVSDVMLPYDGFVDVLPGDAPASEALKRMLHDKKGILAVIEETGDDLIGIVTRSDLSFYLEMLHGSAPE